MSNRSGTLKGTIVETGAGIKMTRQGRQAGRRTVRRQVVDEGDAPATGGAGINFAQQVFDEQETHLRSKFDSGQSLVLINQGHPDYKEEYSDRGRRYQYFHLLLAKELTLFNWGREEPSSLLEHLVELEVTAKRYQGNVRT